ncbi:MAG: hypothetical protein M3680_29405 [Myxococcota bacterium]|nr:hypothetical protein [Myxococcota bacterium]
MPPAPRSLVLALIGVLLPVAAPTVAAADDDDPGSITTTLAFAVGSSSVGATDGVIAPGGHFDVGFRVRRWRLAAELDTALWSTQGLPDDVSESGSFVRGGVALRWHVMDEVTRKREHRPSAAYRIYVEGGVGRQRVQAPGLDVARGDVMLGLGVAPEIALGSVLFGATFGLRVLIAHAPDAPGDRIARSTCTDCTAGARHDVTLLYVLGITVGR